MLKEDEFHRFMDKVAHEPNSGCWLWLGTTAGAGYGVFHLRRDGKRFSKYAHRLSYEMNVGPIPEGLEIDHKCRVRTCLNPHHLEAVTHRENMLRGETIVALCSQKTHCVHGHEFTPENTAYTKSRKRVCIECRRIQGRKRDKEEHRTRIAKWRRDNADRWKVISRRAYKKKRSQELGLDYEPVANKDKTHCPHGHQYTDENTYVCKRGIRHCRACKRIKARALRSAKKEQ